MNSRAAPVLLLMRHAKSSWKEASLPDHDRPLKKRGRRAARAMAIFLQSHDLTPHTIITSSAVRARETAQIVLEEFPQAQLHILPELYHAEVPVWREQLATWPTAGALLVIGHNPGLEELVSEIAGRQLTVPTAAVVCLKADPAASNYAAENLTFTQLWTPREVRKPR